jgi:hypothetical protein
VTILSLKRRVENLSEKLKTPSPGCFVHLDFDSFSEPEKQLFAKVEEIEKNYVQTGSLDNLPENAALVLKKVEVIFKRIRELYCYAAQKVWGLERNREIVEHFFRLYFYNFEVDLTECLENFDGRSEKEKAEFLLDLKKNGVIIFRLPRRSIDYDDEEFDNLDNLEMLGKNKEEKEEN